MAKSLKPILQGAPEWIVTFADLMSLLVCFFVLIISFSTQDKQKVQVVAGSMKEAFGVTKVAVRAGMIEIDGSPVRDYVKSVAQISRPTDSDFAEKHNSKKSKQGPQANTHEHRKNKVETKRHFALAATSLKQVWRDMPDIAEMSDNVLVEDTPEGLHIQLVDQDGRAMFPAGSVTPHEHTKRILTRMAPIIKALPNRVTITGHTDSAKHDKKNRYSPWELTAKRANAARAILAQAGLPDDHIFSVTGKANLQPLFPEDPFMAGNRRISILIMKESPPLPSGHRP